MTKKSNTENQTDSLPPKFWARILSWFCHPDYAEDIEGDLAELYKERVADIGRKKARLHYIKDVLLLLRPTLIRPLEGYSRLNSYGMLKNYLIIAFRIFRRESAFSFLNLLGLILGLVCASYIYLWVQDEYQFNHFPPQSEKLARILVNLPPDDQGNIQTWKGLPFPLKEVLEEKYPEFDEVSVISDNFPVEFKRNDNYLERQGAFMTPSGIDMFGMSFITGGKQLFINEPASLLISENFAKEYFGVNWQDENILDMTIESEEDGSFKVAGVFKNLPTHSTLQFDFAIPFKYAEMNFDWLKNWGTFSNRFFVRVNDYVSLETANNKVKNAIIENGDDIESKATLFLQPFSDIYLHDKIEDGKISGGRIEYVNLLVIFGIFILAVTLANFANLTTARQVKRSKESGIRKTLGAVKTNLRVQFLMESVLISLFASIISLVVAYLTLPYFNLITGKQIQSTIVLNNILPYLMAIGLVGGIITGIFPALYMASINTIKALKGGRSKATSADVFRKGLVVFQFIVAVIMITSSVIFYLQVDFLFNKNIGLVKSGIIYMDIPKFNSANQFYSYKNEMLKNNKITTLTLISGSPISGQPETSDVSWNGKNENNQTVFHIINSDPEFIPVTQVKLKEGRNFFWDLKTDSANYIVNETAARAIGDKDILGKELEFWGVKGKIIGVVEDFHLENLFSEIEPLVIRNDIYKAAEKVFIKLNNENQDETIKHIEKVHKTFNPGRTFVFNYLEEEYRNTYKSEALVKNMVLYFAITAGIISCLGLLGLVAYTVTQRTKEIAIRKTLGASIIHIFNLLSRAYILMVIAALILGLPVSFFLMDNFLHRYAYHVDLEWTVFLTTGILFFLITLITIGYHTIKAIYENPVISLRNE